MINCVPKFVAGPPPKLIPGQFLLYESGEYALVGSNTAITSTQKIVKHTTLRRMSWSGCSRWRFSVRWGC